jgi:hypothetical protein
MQRKSFSKRRDDDPGLDGSRPTALSLITHILRSLVTDGMQWLLIPAVLLVMYLRHIHFGQEILPVVIFGGLAIMAILNGCKAWQSDLDEYRRHRVLSHHLNAVPVKKDIPGFSPGRRF